MIKDLRNSLFPSSKYLSRLKLLFKKEKVSKTGNRYKVAIEIEFEQKDKNPPSDLSTGS
jgi:hypothetical protein